MKGGFPSRIEKGIKCRRTCWLVTTPRAQRPWSSRTAAAEVHLSRGFLQMTVVFLSRKWVGAKFSSWWNLCLTRCLYLDFCYFPPRVCLCCRRHSPNMSDSVVRPVSAASGLKNAEEGVKGQRPVYESLFWLWIINPTRWPLSWAWCSLTQLSDFGGLFLLLNHCVWS